VLLAVLGLAPVSYPLDRSEISATIPSCVAFGAPATGGPMEPVKMTFNECCDDVWWRPYLGTSQRNHDHQCSKSLV
jgi:hypothetical protein